MTKKQMNKIYCLETFNVDRFLSDDEIRKEVVNYGIDMNSTTRGIINQLCNDKDVVNLIIDSDHFSEERQKEIEKEIISGLGKKVVRNNGDVVYYHSCYINDYEGYNFNFDGTLRVSISFTDVVKKYEDIIKYPINSYTDIEIKKKDCHKDIEVNDNNYWFEKFDYNDYFDTDYDVDINDYYEDPRYYVGIDLQIKISYNIPQIKKIVEMLMTSDFNIIEEGKNALKKYCINEVENHIKGMKGLFN